MRRLISLLLILTASISVFAQKKGRPEPNFYRNLYTGDILNKKEFEEFRQALYTDFNDSIRRNVNITLRFMSLKISNDSMIQSFNYDLRVGNEYKKRANTYDKIGKDITPRTFQTLEGQNIEIGGKQLKPTLINLWFIGCRGCVEEIPALNLLKEKYADKVNFVALTFNKKESVEHFLSKKNFNFTHIPNCEDFIKKIGSYPYPENIFIDRNGIIRYIEGGLPPSENLDLVIKHFESIIDELLLQTRVNK